MEGEGGGGNPAPLPAPLYRGLGNEEKRTAGILLEEAVGLSPREHGVVDGLEMAQVTLSRMRMREGQGDGAVGRVWGSRAE